MNILLNFTPEQPQKFRSNLAVSCLRMQSFSSSIEETSSWESECSWIGQEFSEFCGHRNSVAVFAGVHLWTVFWTSWKQTTLSHSLSVRPANALYSILCLTPWNCFFQIFLLKVCTHGSYRSRIRGCGLGLLSLIEFYWRNSMKKTMCFTS